MSKLIDLHREIILCFFKHGLSDHPMNIAFISLFRNYFFPPYKTPAVTSQNKEENYGNFNVLIFFFFLFGCGVNIELCEAHGEMKKQGCFHLEKGGVKREVIFNVESDLFLFLEILVCGIADVVFSDWVFFFFCFIYLQRENVGWKKGRKESPKIWEVFMFWKVPPTQTILCWCSSEKKSHKKSIPVVFNGSSLNYSRFMPPLGF